MTNPTIQIPVPEFKDAVHRWQLEVLRKFDQNLHRFFLLCWHRRARKTTLILNLLIREAVKNPKSVYGYIGPTYRQAKAIIWRDPNMLDRYLPGPVPGPVVKRKNETELFIEFQNGSILVVKGADEPDAIRGMDFAGVGLDEWALMKLEVWEQIIRPVITQSADRWAMFAFTPNGQNHAYDYWEKSPAWPDWYRSILKASTSELLPAAELEKAKAEMPGAQYNQEFECDFIGADEYVLIPRRNIEQLKNVTHYIPPEKTKKIISVDPAYGGDECVLYAWENTEIIDSRYLYDRDTMKVAGEIMLMAHRNGKIHNIAIDVIGMKPLADRLAELGKNVLEVNSACRKDIDPQYYNLRAKMWCEAADRIRDGELEYPQDDELRRQLSAVKYEVADSSGRVRIEPKLKVKSRIGCSPDRADAYIYGIWGLSQIEPEPVNSISNSERMDIETRKKILDRFKRTEEPIYVGTHG